MLLPAYDLCKAAQAAAFFAIKSGGVINVLKLSKLMYLAERESMRRYDEPMFFDGLASMPDGPVASITLNFINGENMSPEWSSVVGARIGYDIPLARKNITIDDLDHLSRADRGILQNLWDRFGSWDRFQLRDWTHVPENIPEWQDPEGSSRSIAHATVFEALDKRDAEKLHEDVLEMRRLHRVLDRAAG